MARRWGLGVFAMALMASGASQAADFMVTGARTTQPIGHYYFCRQLPRECEPDGTVARPVAFTAELRTMLSRVNTAVNTQIEPRTDMEIWGKEEVWSYPTTVGDCEDFVLEKRRRLIGMGIAQGDLLITVLRQQNGDGHAVLTVRTTAGDYILDNLDGRVRLWSETNYTFLKRQSERDPGVWLSINDGRDDAVASVR